MKLVHRFLHYQLESVNTIQGDTNERKNKSNHLSSFRKLSKNTLGFMDVLSYDLRMFYLFDHIVL